MDTPYGFKVDLDPELFTLDRLDALYRKAQPLGKGVAQDAALDKGFDRKGDPEQFTLAGPVADEAAKRPLQIYMNDVTEYAPEYAPLRDQVLDAAGIDRSQPMFHLQTNIRIFSVDADTGFHADPETQINCGVGGRSHWRFTQPSAISQEEHENLLHGGHFMPFRDVTWTHDFDLHVGDACAAPPRWPHVIDHPGPDPGVSFEVGFFTAEDIRERKVYDINWMWRKVPMMSPRPPLASPRVDRRKQKMFDVIARATRRGTEFIGV